MLPFPKSMMLACGALALLAGCGKQVMFQMDQKPFIAQPIYTGGSLTAQLFITAAQRKQALLQYQKAIQCMTGADAASAGIR